jgi:hypothetical protein
MKIVMGLLLLLALPAEFYLYFEWTFENKLSAFSNTSLKTIYLFVAFDILMVVQFIVGVALIFMDEAEKDKTE